jgi:hypothetical protein
MFKRFIVSIAFVSIAILGIPERAFAESDDGSA